MGVDVVKKTEEAEITVTKFAQDIGVTPERLLSQFKEASINIIHVDDVVTQEQQKKLLRYLQQHHGAKQETSPEKIVFHRAQTSRIRLARGEGKTVNVRVLKKRTLVKRHLTEEETHLPTKSVAPAEIVLTTMIETSLQVLHS